MVLLVLAGIWAVVLIPPAIRARAEGRPGDSISAFRRQLTVLRRTGPQVVRPTGSDHRYRSHTASASSLSVHGPLRSNRGATAVVAARPQVAGPSGTAASAARSRTMRRRRDVLSALVVAVVSTLVLGLVPALRVLWAANVVADVLLGAYVALLVHQRNVAAERDMKVRYLPRRAHTLDPALLRAAEPALLRRSAN